jgi:hypothetical protein
MEERIYKYTMTHSIDEVRDRMNDILTEEELDFLAYDVESIDIYLDGDKYTWKDNIPGVISFSINILDDEKYKRLRELEHRILEGLEGDIKIEDITEEVLYDLHDCNQYGFANDAIRIMFYDWRKKYLEADNVLDKISLYGIESITQQEKDFLETGILNNPYDYYII